jgi:hypothetical protein
MKNLKNPYIWLVIVINLAILALTPRFPEGIQRMIPFTCCLVGDVVLWFVARKAEDSGK